MDWQNWCRLCAEEDSQSGVDVLLKQEDQDPWEEGDPLTSKSCSATTSLLAAMEHHFHVHPTHEDQLPTRICAECYSLLTSVTALSERVGRVQKMYKMLHKNIKGQRKLDLESVRLEFGLLEEQGQILPKQEYTETTPQGIEESLIEMETEPTFSTNPLAQPTVLTHIKAESWGNMTSDGGPQADLSEERMDANNSRSSRLRKFRRRRRKAPSVSISDEDLSDSASAYKERQLPGKQRPTITCPQCHEEVRNLRLHLVRKHAASDEDLHGCASAHKERQLPGKQRPTITCPQCHEVVRNLRLHLVRKHAASGEALQVNCDNCPRTFASKHLLASHSRVHVPMELKKIIPCPHCDKKFCTKSLVQTHIKHVHLDERPFVCEECGVALRTMAVLKDHMLLHTDLLPFSCDVCGKAFKRQNTLRRHKDIHSATKYVCNICGLELNSRVTFRRHQLVHRDAMEHKCDYCGRAFKRAQTLKNHLILHTGLKPYACDFCDATFTSGPNCRAHKKRNHPKELAAWEASGNEMYTRNVPKLADLKAFTKAAKKKGSHLLSTKESEQASCSSSQAH